MTETAVEPTAAERVGQEVRGMHPAHFRSGEWALILGTLTVPIGGEREVWVVRFPDGKMDLWVCSDPAVDYEFREPENVWSDTDARLLALAEHLGLDEAERLKRLLSADASAHLVVYLADRLHRSEDLARELRRQMDSAQRRAERAEDLNRAAQGRAW